MSKVILPCDQAIFTSVRGPMGEGYRIIAASKGLRPDEKQTITRNSPSHDALCAAEGSAGVENSSPVGAAFYPLPTGKLCVALSCEAGAEHTGRGGERVYTLAICFAADRFASVRFNPMNVLRALRQEGLHEPQLSPPQILPDLNLAIGIEDRGLGGARWCRDVAPAARRYVLQQLLDDRGVVLNQETDWLDAVEGIVLGIPGPLRAKVSWAAGMKYSVGRAVKLHLLFDRTPTTKSRSTGQRVEFVEPAAVKDAASRTQWVSFVDRMWDRANLTGLSSRTSRPFGDVGPEARERAARLFTAIEEIPKIETPRLMAMVNEHLVSRGGEAERDLAKDLLEGARFELTRRFNTLPWGQLSLNWSALMELAGRSSVGGEFAAPIIHNALRTVLRTDPLSAARAALPLAHLRQTSGPNPHDQPAGAAGLRNNSVTPVPGSALPRPAVATSPYLRKMLASARAVEPEAAQRPRCEPLSSETQNSWDGIILEVLTHLLRWADQVSSDKLGDVASLVECWRSARPGCAVVRQLVERTSKAFVQR